MNIKTIAVSGAALLSTFALGFGGVAMANSLENQQNLAINASGQVALSGKVSAVSGSTISVTSWLGTWQVNASSATFLPQNTTLANIAVGDTVKVAGTLGTGMAINAKTIKDTSLNVLHMGKDNPRTAEQSSNDEKKDHKNWKNINWGAFFKNWKKN